MNRWDSERSVMRYQVLSTVMMAVGLSAMGGSGAHAEPTPWLKAGQARDYVHRVFKRELYPTRIECAVDTAGDMAVRFHVARTTPETKPFHKWQFVMTEPGGIEAAIAAIPLRDRPDLRYRVISRDRAGSVGECAVVYR